MGVNFAGGISTHHTSSLLSGSGCLIVFVYSLGIFLIEREKDKKGKHTALDSLSSVMARDDTFYDHESLLTQLLKLFKLATGAVHDAKSMQYNTHYRNWQSCSIIVLPYEFLAFRVVN